MTNYFKTRTKLVEYASDTIHNLKPGSQLIIAITRDSYGDFSVLTATGELLAGTEKEHTTFSSEPMSTSTENTPVF